MTISPRLRRGLLAAMAGLALVRLVGEPRFVASALPILTVAPITWNVVGLDSNDVNVGPNNFPVGARVCNSGTTAATNVVADFVWDSADAYIDLRAGSQDPIGLAGLAAGACGDFYFEVTVTRDAAAYDNTRRFHIEVASDQTGPIGTPSPREIYVEHLISQSRNATTDVRLDGVSIPAGGTMALVVGNSYTIELIGQTATNGYEQIETFVNFPNTIFRVDSVVATYSANGGTDPQAASKLYADGCGWVNDPNSPNYRACSGTGKYGGAVSVTYDVTIIAGGGTSQTLGTLIYDFSGSSYHYNADFSTSARIAVILDPSTLTLSKNFVPDPTNAGGVSVLTFTITNPNAAAVGGLNFTDVFPTTPGAMVVASPTGATTTGCGTPTFAPVAGGGSISFSSGSVAANSSCTIRVNVTPPAAGTYNNASTDLFVGTTDTGSFATDTLTVDTSPPPPACVPGVAVAQWTFPTGFNASAPTPASGSGSASPGAGVAPLAFSAGTDSWGSNGAIASGSTLDTANNDYFEFAVNSTGFTSLSLTFDARRASGANSPIGVAVYHGSAPGNPETGTPLFSNSTVLTTTFANIGGTHTFTPAGSPAYVRIYLFNAGNSVPGSDAMIDNVTLTGCGIPDPPTMAKAFSPNPVAVGASSTLTFTITNPNSSTALSGIAFSDTLPAGLTVASASTAQCGGTLTSTAPDSLVFAGGTLGAGSSCTVTVSLTAATAGPHDNVSGFVSSTESGANTGPTGIASDSLTAVLPPAIAKNFSPDPILAGGTSTLTFILTNPNPNDALSGVAFSDIFPVAPGAMVVASPTGASTTGCGVSTYAPVIGAGSISFSSGTIAGGGACTVTVNVTVPSNGTYSNTSGNVSHVINAATVNGNTATDTLTANPPNPAIGMLKQVGATGSGPWQSFLPVATAGDVYYRFTIENIGDVPLSPVGVSDPDVDTSGCSWPATLPVASPLNDDHIATCGVGPITAVSGSHPNTATASGTYSSTVYTDTSTATYATTALTLVKTAAQTTFLAAGNTLDYSYLVTNSGFAPLAGPVTIADDQSTDEACPAVDSVGDLDAFLDPGESLTCTATYTVTAGDVSAASVTNTAVATAGGVDSNADSETVLYLAPPAVTKTFLDSPIGAGATSRLRIALDNPGGTALTNVSFTDTYPVTIVNAATPNPSTTCSGGTVLATAGGGSATLSGASLPAGGACTVEVSVTSSTLGAHVNTIPAGGVTTAQGVSNTSVASDTLLVTVTVDVSLDKQVNDAGPDVGDTVTFTLVVANGGPGAATNIDLTDVVPSGYSYVAASISGGDGRDDTNPSTTGLTWTINSLASGGSTNLTYQALVLSSGTYDNYAQVMDHDQGDSDSTPGNDSTAEDDDDEVTVTPTALTPPSVSKDFSPNTITSGGTSQLTITLGNTNAAAATLTSALVDTLPVGVVAANPTNVGGTCTGTVTAVPGGTTITYASGATIPSGGCTLLVDVSSSTVGTHTNMIAAGDLQTDVGSNAAPASADLTVTQVQVTDPAVTKSGDPSTASVGDTIVFTLVITNNGTDDAADVVVTDAIPTFLTIQSTAVAPAGPTVGIAGNTITIGFGTLSPGETYAVTISTVVNSSAIPPGGQNSVTLTTTSPDADPTNNVDSAAITIVVPGLAIPETGFAPGRLTWLPPQPADKTYLDYGDLWLEIPSIDVRTSIIGVPQSGGGWDVSWLGELAGYLDGTAFPTWAGNSVVTAHVTLVNGQPGPFENLKSLGFGDRVIVHAWGLRHTYEIREVDLVSPADRAVFRHEERSWLTLVTCHGYDEREATYRWRVAARSVLVSIEAEEGGAVLDNISSPFVTNQRPPGMRGGR